MPNAYLAFGGGVNSTALYILLKQEDQDFEAVFADHGTDWPETYAYINWMNTNGHPVIRLKTTRDGSTLYDYYWQHHMIPMRQLRHCTDHFKIRPALAFYDQPCIEYLGFDVGECHRADRINRDNVQFPLIERGIDREGCLQIIQDAGWPIPRKSGCFLCPFQRVGQWEELSRKHPHLLEKAIALERRCNDLLSAKNRAPLYLADPYPARIAATDRFARRVWRKQQQGQINFWGLADLEQCPYCTL